MLAKLSEHFHPRDLQRAKRLLARGWDSETVSCVIDASCSEVCIQQTNVSRIFYSQFVHLSRVLRWLEAARLSVAGFCRDTEEEAAGRSGSGRAEEREF